jgi:PAS domain S-box-containing protein
VLVEEVTQRVRAERERKETERVLASQLRLMETISSNGTLALFLMDERQHCTFMNPAAEQMTSYRLVEVQGRPLHEFVHHLRPDGTPYLLAECPIGGVLPTRSRMQGEEVFVHKDGSFYPVAFTASPILAEGEPVGTVIEVQDITERKRAEDLLSARVRQQAVAADLGGSLPESTLLSCWTKPSPRWARPSRWSMPRCWNSCLMETHHGCEQGLTGPRGSSGRQRLMPAPTFKRATRCFPRCR